MREKLEKELADYKRKLAAAQKNNLLAGIAKAEKEIARIESEIEALPKQLSYEEWWAEIRDKIENKIEVTTSDAQGILEVQDALLLQLWADNVSSENAAEKIIKASTVKEKKSKSKPNKGKKSKKPMGKDLGTILETQKSGDNAIVKGKKQKSKEKFSEIDTEKKWKHDSVVIKHSDEHYIVLYAGDTKNDAEVKFIDGQWELICKQVKDYPKFKMDEIEDAINFVLEIKHFIATRPERQEKAKKRAKINANKSEAKKAEEAVEKVAESVEEKIEQLKEEGKKVTETTANNIALDVKTIVKAVKSGMKAEERRKFVNKLINELKKLL